jgi:predicted nucleotide-binding protein
MPPPKEKSLRLLQKSLEKLKTLRNSEQYGDEFEVWEETARRAIRFAFGEGSQSENDFDAALSRYTKVNKLYTIEKADAFRDSSVKVAALLSAMIEEIEDYWEPTIDRSPAQETASRDKKVFIVHGHDDGAKEKVARFLTTVGLKPVILHEQANKGKAIIEKFEDHAEVTFAVVLLTPDDVGAAHADREHLRPRPRQNVLFEFGYFIGKLGRDRVCGLKKGDVEIPSDYSGVIYIELDPGDAWHIKLSRELREAGLPVNVDALV